MKTILFGNGLNYLSENYITWDKLLEKIKGGNKFLNGNLPNTMIYERSIISHPLLTDTLIEKEEIIKNDIALLLKDAPSNEAYKKIIDLEADNYLTTNYDYAFLASLNEDFKIENKSTESIYSIRRFKELMKNGKHFSKLWHIHGELDIIPSLMLGLDHYCGSVGKIDSYVKGKYEYQLDKENHKIPSIKDKLIGKESFDNSSWIELFFNSEVHIIGLSLDYSEIDIWWILNKRARLMLDSSTKNLINNKIIFYTIKEDDVHKGLLETLNVDVKFIQLDNSESKYINAYDNIISLIKNYK